MRKLQSTDIFACCRLITEIGLKDDIKQLVLGVNNTDNLSVDEIGFNILWSIFDKATSVEAETRFLIFFQTFWKRMLLI